MSEERLEKLRKLQKDAEGIYGNIEWNMAGLIMSAVLVLNPRFLFLQSIPKVIPVDGLNIDGFQVFGLTLAEHEREDRAKELIAAAKRALICESLEVGADLLVRCARILHSGKDPYEIDQNFTANISELWNARRGKAGHLIEAEDRAFVQKCAAPLRHWIRHNNGKILPKKTLYYDGSPRGRRGPSSVRVETGL
ncbi:MAG: hypothetical protein DRG83_05790 [Deltaproteobacteria bacterium]|nr:MAG: hypothetical protein DRG83_05790 [Deltaproteobacteria bacterium]